MPRRSGGWSAGRGPTSLRPALTVKIVITSPIFPPDLGGPATYVPSIATYLVEQGHEVKVVAFCSDPDPQGWPFEVVSVPRAWMPVRYLKSFMAVLKHARDCDLLYINEHLAYLVALAGRLRGRRMVIRVCVDGTWEISHRMGLHDDAIGDYVHRDYGWRVAWARRLQRKWWDWMGAIIAPSQFLKDIVEHYGVEPEKVRLIHNAYHGPLKVDLDRAAARRRLDLPGDRVVLLCIARLMVWKGVDGLIRALDDFGADHHLYVAGDGTEEQAWTQLAEGMGLGDRVHFLGNVPYADIPAWIRASDLFLLNSRYEGLSHTLLEVMWLGTPAAVSGVCGNPELIEDGVTGRTYDFQDVPAIVDAIRDLTGNREHAQELAEASRQKVQGFARSTIFARTEDLFREIAGVS